MSEYPSVRYSKAGDTRIVNSSIEDEALGTDWADTPAAFYTEAQRAAADNPKGKVSPKAAAVAKAMQEEDKPPVAAIFGDGTDLNAERDRLIAENAALKQKKPAK